MFAPSDKNDLVADEMGSLPAVYFKLHRALENPEIGFAELAQIVGSDSSMASRLLRIVNSPFYGFSSKIETITRGLEIIGIAQLQHLVLATTVMKSFKGIPETLVNMDAFWRHSIAVGVSAQEIAAQKDMGNMERFFLQGMLHDIGKLILYKKLPEASAEVIRLAMETREESTKIENDIIGYDHAAVGEALLEKWNLPPALIEVVAYHHEPQNSANHFFEAATICMANALAHEMGWSAGDHVHSKILTDKMLENLSLEKKDVEAIKLRTKKRFDEIVHIFL
jgi:putative nucleotidyltransferase with HDIG domain